MLVALAVMAAACGGDEEADTVRVGVGSTTEQQVLAALTVVALEEADVATELTVDLGDTVGLRREALRGSIDVYWDYTGAAWALGLRQQNPPAEPDESFERMREADDTNGLLWLAPTSADATLALFVHPDSVPDDQPATMEWLAGEVSGGERRLCIDPDFRDRPGGLPDLAEVYPMDLERLDVRGADESEAVAGVAAGECFAGLASATSGEAHAAGLVRARDELGVFPAFVVAPVVRAAALERVPELPAALAPVVELLDTPTLARLNAVAMEADSADERQELARRELADYLEAATD